jgi:hypothetical protein
VRSLRFIMMLLACYQRLNDGGSGAKLTCPHLASGSSIGVVDEGLDRVSRAHQAEGGLTSRTCVE